MTSINRVLLLVLTIRIDGEVTLRDCNCFYQMPAGGLVPIYIGKGSLPSRPLAHLGLQNQFFDQVMAFYFGGLHGRPWREGDIDQSLLRQRLSPIRLGFCFYATGDDREAKRTIANYERAFQQALHPIGNSGYYPPEIPDFSLDRLVAQWPRNGQGKPSVNPDELERLIADCTGRHHQCIADAPASTERSG